MSLLKLAEYAVDHDLPLHLAKNEDGQLMLAVEGLGKTWIHPMELANFHEHSHISRLLDGKALTLMEALRVNHE